MKLKKAEKIIQSVPADPSAFEKALESISCDARTDPREMVMNFITPEGGE